MPLDKVFWGAIYGRLTCPYGHTWSVHQQLPSGEGEQEAKKAKVDETQGEGAKVDDAQAPESKSEGRRAKCGVAFSCLFLFEVVLL
jgi:hypothetical protein